MSARYSESGNPLLYLFRKMWQYSAGSRKMLVSYQGMYVLAVFLTLILTPLVTAKMMDAVVDVIRLQVFNTAVLKKLCVLAVLPFFIRFLFWALHGPARVMENINAFKVKANYRGYLLKGILGLPLEWHNEHHSGDVIDKAEKGTNALFDFSADSFEIVYAILKFVGSFVILVLFFPASAPIIIVFIFLTGSLVMKFDRKMIPQYRELSRAENWAAEGIFDAISNISTVIILRVEKLVYDGLMKRTWKRYDVYKENNVANEIKWFATSMCSALMTSAVFVWYFWYYRHEVSKITVGSVYILYKYLEEMSDTFFSFTGLYGQVVRRSARLGNAEELSVYFKDQSLTDHVLPADWQRLEVQDLSFSYHTEEGDLHLEGVNLYAKRGERIALVGHSGAGKSTLLKIIRDLFHPRALRLTVDGVVVPQGFAGIARAISLIPQNPEIFKTTICENITLGADHGQGAIERSMHMACFKDVVGKLPKGLESSVKEKGVNLSGGEQQRLALARGLLASADKDIVLLDEPTASIDAANEMEIYTRIFRELKGKTIISTIHRLHLLPYFDRIYLFEQGRVVAEGTLQELLRTSEDFQDLWAKYVIEKDAQSMNEIGQKIPQSA